MEYRTSIGLDVHARSIRAAAFIPETGEVVERPFDCSAAEIASWARKLPQPARAVYESGPTGFHLARDLESLGVPCSVGAVSKMFRPAGDRVKTDKRDAVFLARMLAVGNIVEVRIPSADEEAARDLTRQREDAREDLTRAKLLLTHFLLRHGIVYSEGKTWTAKYRAWIASLKFENETDQFVFDEYLTGVGMAEQRRNRIDERIRRIAESEPYAERVNRLRCLRGVNVLTAFSLVVEIGDFGRFPSARAFMAYLGLVPSESSSGETVSRGEITKTGNAHIRKLLTEAAWAHSRRYNPTSVTVNGDLSRVSPEVARKADKANRRLHDRYSHLQRKGKNTCLINSAIAREMAGWIWALENEVA